MEPVLTIGLEMTPHMGNNTISISGNVTKISNYNQDGDPAKFGMDLTRDNLSGFILAKSDIMVSYSYSPNSECNCRTSVSRDGKIIPLKKKQICTCGFDGLLTLEVLSLNKDDREFNGILSVFFKKVNDETEIILDSKTEYDTVVDNRIKYVLVSSSGLSGYKTTIKDGSPIYIFFTIFSAIEPEFDGTYMFPNVIVKKNIGENSNLMSDREKIVKYMCREKKSLEEEYETVAKGYYGVTIGVLDKDSGKAESNVTKAIRI